MEGCARLVQRVTRAATAATATVNKPAAWADWNPAPVGVAEVWAAAFEPRVPEPCEEVVLGAPELEAELPEAEVELDEQLEEY